jgi:hypothetical protein
VREVTVTQPGWTYPNAQFMGDFGTDAVLMVAQISDRFGPGPFTSTSLLA